MPTRSLLVTLALLATPALLAAQRPPRPAAPATTFPPFRTVLAMGDVPANGASPIVEAVCPDGTQALTGGYGLGLSASNDPARVFVTINRPSLQQGVDVREQRPPRGWEVQVRAKDQAVGFLVLVTAVCAPMAP